MKMNKDGAKSIIENQIENPQKQARNIQSQ